MALDRHLTELERKHQYLERELQSAKAHPSVDDLKIAHLKKEKLRLRDEISKLRTGATRH